MSEAKKPTQANNKQIMDVSRPGKSAPSATSKPVIVSNRPILKDPMVNEDPNAGTEVSGNDTKVISVPGKIKVQPLSVLTDKEESPPATPEAKAEQPSEEPSPSAEPKAEETPAAEAETAEDTETSKAGKPTGEETESSDNPEVQQPSNDIDAKVAEEAAKHEAAIQALVEGKKYYLPVNSVEKRRTKRIVALGILLSILLALAWVDVALDAGLIHISGVKPVTHFFTN